MEIESQLLFEWLVGDEFTADIIVIDRLDFHFLAEPRALVVIQDKIDQRLLADADIMFP